MNIVSIFQAMGPILPQTNVIGKELGISPDVMGFITSFLPILYILAKPAVGYLIDSFPVSEQEVNSFVDSKCSE